MTHTGIPTPNSRRLRGYSFDPSLSVQLDTALVNEAVFKIRWEEPLKQGPVGEYLEVVDFDPASNCFYEPIDLNDPYILAQDGLQPSESNPQFHQQMAYAVAMTTIQNFEKALGRKALWSPYRGDKSENYVRRFVQRLRIYPHALRQANAYYSPMKKALMFGYFPASSDAPGDHIPKGMVFTCLSHDIVAHETTHALLDGMHERFIEDSHPDTLAFHEAFADIVALFQHFSFPEVLRQQIAKTRGDLASQSLLGQLAQQFGKAIGQYGALRDAIGEFDKKENKWKPRQPDPNDYQRELEPHARGAILVAAVFEAFLSIYKCRVTDLLRIASNGTGILIPGELHPDLVNRLAREAAKTAQQVLNMCIRGLDYCPPVDINFGDYLRAIITADTDLVPEDDMGYRIAFIESFRRRGIYPRDIRTLSESSLSWTNIREEEQQGIFRVITSRLRFFVHLLSYLDEIPNVDQVAEVSPEYRNYLKSILLPDAEKNWNGLDVEKRAKTWKNAFENYPPPNKDWRLLSQDEKRKAEKVLWNLMSDREKIFGITRAAQAALHEWLADYKADANSEDVRRFENLTGIYLLQTIDKEPRLQGLKSEKDKYTTQQKYTFEVHSFRGAQRVGPNGNTVNDVIISLTQKRVVPMNPGTPGDDETFDFRGGCTLILDLHTLKLKYVVKKLIDDSDGRLTRQGEYRTGESGASLRATYFGRPGQTGNNEPFALLHGD
ncbi:MAG TPA: hypothetical protein VN643_05610 [Pyrinomonadaceae bacterium]|nr:hypothetical protein [Pyrinomonadaceae bacterium]